MLTRPDCRQVQRFTTRMLIQADRPRDNLRPQQKQRSCRYSYLAVTEQEFMHGPFHLAGVPRLETHYREQIAYTRLHRPTALARLPSPQNHRSCFWLMATVINDNAKEPCSLSRHFEWGRVRGSPQLLQGSIPGAAENLSFPHFFSLFFSFLFYFLFTLIHETLALLVFVACNHCIHAKGQMCVHLLSTVTR